MISKKELQYLRDLAKTQIEFANASKMTSLKKEWTEHGAFQGKRPMLMIETNTFFNDIFPLFQTCENEEAIELERMFVKNTINHEFFMDDTIVKGYLEVNWNKWLKPWNIDVKVERADSLDHLGHHFVSQITDLESDFHLFQKSIFHASKQEAIDKVNYLNELFGDIIPAKAKGRSLYASPTQDLVHIMSMEDMFVAMYDAPEKFLKVMDQLADDYIEFNKHLAKEGYLNSTTEEEELGNGTVCFTNELPKRETELTTKDVWGYLDSQETVGISPEMFDELVFPAYRKIAAEYGLLSYGCCEPVDPVWEKSISKLENLRKVSISPWCNEEYMGEQLRGKNIVYLRKPTPNILGVGTTLDEQFLKETTKKTLLAADGCHIEFAVRDVYNVNKDIPKVARYVEIIREQIAANT